ncbi:hypothetical protein BCR33DRAFT_715047, partial [Rhizoclosmatium globosum]
ESEVSFWDETGGDWEECGEAPARCRKFETLLGHHQKDIQHNTPPLNDAPSPPSDSDAHQTLKHLNTLS